MQTVFIEIYHHSFFVFLPLFPVLSTFNNASRKITRVRGKNTKLYWKRWNMRHDKSIKHIQKITLATSALLMKRWIFFQNIFKGTRFGNQGLQSRGNCNNKFEYFARRSCQTCSFPQNLVGNHQFCYRNSLKLGDSVFV